MANELDNFRREIDALDDQITELLKQRLSVVARVGDLKRQTAPGIFPIRSGREAKMLRRMADVFKDSGFSPAAATAIWRIIIGTSTALEEKLSISVFSSDKECDAFWLAREYFGPAASIAKQPQVKRVIADVLDGISSVGVVPKFSGNNDDTWWTSLIQQGKNAPKIFAHLPFAYNGEGKNFPSAFAFARLEPEASGDDTSLYVLDVDGNVSQHKLQTALGTEGISANSLSVAASGGQRQHLIELKGFFAPDDKKLQKALSTLGNDLRQAHFLGAYANPFTIKP